jgi:hypothetical protein
VDQAAQHLLQVINDILDLSKIEAGKMQLEHIEFSRDALLSGAWPWSANRPGPRAWSWCWTPTTCPPHARRPQAPGPGPHQPAGQRRQVHRTGLGAPGRRLLAEDGHRLQLKFEVSDSGVGIAPEQQGALFQAFEQADASTTRRHGGTGLGLALTRKIAGLMGGEAGMSSRPGEAAASGSPPGWSAARPPWTRRPTPCWRRSGPAGPWWSTTCRCR